MLDLENIKNEIGEKIYRRNPKAALVEYLQYEMLDSIFKQKNSSQLSFMGGTAIRIIYGSNRFSEDLDFDNFNLSFTEFKKIIEQSAKDVEYKGFKIEIRFTKKNAYHAYIKFPKLLFDNKLSGYYDEKILIRVDSINRSQKDLISTNSFILNGFGIYRKILVNQANTILSQKIIAVLGRKRSKGRDFFDISYLLGKTLPNYEYLEKFAGINQKNLKAILLRKISKLDLKELARDVEPFLINPEEKNRVLNFKEYIQQVLE